MKCKTKQIFNHNFICNLVNHKWQYGMECMCMIRFMEINPHFKCKASEFCYTITSLEQESHYTDCLITTGCIEIVSITALTVLSPLDALKAVSMPAMAALSSLDALKTVSMTALAALSLLDALKTVSKTALAALSPMDALKTVSMIALTVLSSLAA